MQIDFKEFERLLFEYFSGTISESDSKLLWEYLRSDPEYRTKYDEMAKTWAVLFIPALEKYKHNNYKKVQPRKHISPKLFLKYAASVAAVLLLLTIPAYFFLKSEDIPQTNMTMYYETEASYGSQSKVILPDSTVVWLNAGSKLTYNKDFGQDNRNVELNGEGYFEVSHNKEQPFLVDAGEVQIRIVGTKFNVRNYLESEKIEVDLLEGKVHVKTLDSIHSKYMILSPNQKVAYDKQNKSLLLTDTNASLATLWRNGKPYFRDASLVEISKYLERRYNLEIRIQSKDIRDEIFTGTLDFNQPVEKVLKDIDVENKFSITLSNKHIIITNKNQNTED